MLGRCSGWGKGSHRLPQPAGPLTPPRTFGPWGRSAVRIFSTRKPLAGLGGARGEWWGSSVRGGGDGPLARVGRGRNGLLPAWARGRGRVGRASARGGRGSASAPGWGTGLWPAGEGAGPSTRPLPFRSRRFPRRPPPSWLSPACLLFSNLRLVSGQATVSRKFYL